MSARIPVALELPARDSRASRIDRVTRGVEELRRAALDSEREFATELAAVAPSMRESARNLAHYLGIRRLDVRELQDELARLGLSSLGRMEAHVMASIEAVLAALHAMQRRPIGEDAVPSSAIDFARGDALLDAHANAILGPARRGTARTRIMVTMPGEAAEDPALIADLLEAGMDVMRINGAHDDVAAWERIVEHLRRAEIEKGRRCRVAFDLAGPKLRTGPIEPGPAVAKWRPTRNAVGHVTQLARVRFVERVDEGDGDDAIPVSMSLAEAQRGDTIELEDTRERTRVLHVVDSSHIGECVCETDTTAYVVPGTKLRLRRGHKVLAKGEIGALPAVEQWIALRPGDRLDVLLGETPGRDAVHDDDGRVIEPAFVSCALPQVFQCSRLGQPILFDDGRIRGRISDIAAGRLVVEITATSRSTAKLKGEKGINLPETILDLPALTDKDRHDLQFAARNADMLELSFVQRRKDIHALFAALASIDAPPIGIVLKIETRTAFERLPSLLLEAMRHPSIAVMVARGDLGVEVGFERLAEVQEEILWLCEAAHVPVIWATQVLESLAKGGMPSRAEVTDAAMGSRAECVMLNKGPFIRETLRFLTDVLGRMQEHQRKKTSRLRKLRVSAPAH